MRAAMRKSDIAISAAGQTLYELARMGVPAITVCAADNQARNLEGWRKSGFVLYAGEHGDRKLFDRLSACMTKLASPAKRCKRSILGQSLVDGEGAKRVAEKVIAEARKVRVLLTCVGGKFSLDTLEALKKSENPRIDVIGVDANENVAAKHVVKSFHVVPKGSEWPLKIMQIVEICKQEGVDIIIPCADEEAGAVATNRGLFEKNNIMCAVGNVSNAKLIVDKWKLFEFLSSNNVPMPKYYTIDNVGDLKDRAANFGYPKNKFVVKPRSSRGARGAFIVEKDDPYFSPEKIDYWDNLDLSDHIAMEYLPGPAYDVDVLAKKGEPIYVIPRRREWKNALSPSSEGCVVENNKRLISFVSRIVRVLKLHGVYDFDCGTTRGGNPALFEINPRFSGAVAASLGAGVNMQVMLVKMLLGVDIPKVKIDFGVHMRPLKKKVSFNNEKYRVHKMLFDKGKKKIYADKG